MDTVRASGIGYPHSLIAYFFTISALIAGSVRKPTDIDKLPSKMLHILYCLLVRQCIHFSGRVTVSSLQLLGNFDLNHSISLVIMLLLIQTMLTINIKVIAQNPEVVSVLKRFLVYRTGIPGAFVTI